MRGGLREKRTCTFSVLNHSTVEIVDSTPPVIDLKATADIGREW